MSMGHSRSFRLKRKDSSDLDKKHGNPFNVSNIFKRHSIDKSQAENIRNSQSLKTINDKNNELRFIKSKSVPNHLSGSDSNGSSKRGYTLNGESIDLTKLPELPDLHPIKPVRSKKQEFEAVRRKLIGNHSSNDMSPKKSSSKKTKLDNFSVDTEDDIAEEEDDYEDDDDEIDDDESTSKIVVRDNTSLTGNAENSNKHKLGKKFSLHKHSRNTLRVPSSTPNESELSLNDEDTETQAINQNNHTGIFSTLLNTLNIKSITDVANLNDPHQELQQLDTASINSVVSTDTNVAKNEGVSQVSFVPVKKALITTLGQGSLTLDSFPKNQTLTLPDNQEQKSPLPDNRKSFNLNNVNLNLNLNEEAPQNTNTQEENIHSDTRQKLEARANSNNKLSSILPRKQTLRNSLNSITLIPFPHDGHNGSETEEGEDSGSGSGNLALPMSNSMSIKRKLKLPISKRTSLDINNNNNNNTPDGEGLDSSKKRDALFDKLDIKPLSDKRREAFHSLFPNLSRDEILIEDYACAYRKDILIQGKLYLSDHHISFNSSILGLQTKFSIPLSAILKMLKKKTVGIPNAIEFSNLHNKYIFASLMSRDQAYDLIYKVWKMNLNNNGMDTIDLDIDEDDESNDSVSLVDSGDDEDNAILNENAGANGSPTKAKEADVDTSDTSISDQENMVKDGEEDDKEANTQKTDNTDDNTFNGFKFEGPKTHAPTSSGYAKEADDHDIINANIPAPMGLVFDLLYGDDVSFFKSILKIQKNYDIDDIPKFANNKRKYKYTKPVPVVTKTRCIVEEEIQTKDFEKNCLIVQMTDSPDVPSGNSFKVKTKTYLSWAANNSTNIFVVTSIIWTGKAWFKGQIEKGTYGGQKDALTILVDQLKKKIAAGTTTVAASPKKKKDKKKHRTESQPIVETPTSEEIIEEEQEPEPKSYYELFMDQFDLKLILILLLFIVVITDKFKRHREFKGYELYSSDRMLMSESDLWEWIEKRERNHHNNIKFTNDNDKMFKKSTGLNDRILNQDLKDTIEMMEQQLSELKIKASNSDANALL